MADSGVGAVFFDLGETLGTADVGGRPPKLVGFDVYPFVPAVLAELMARRLRLGVISNTGNQDGEAVNAVLAPHFAPTGKLAALDRKLLVYSGDEGVTKASREIFGRAAKRATLDPTPERCLFVGEDAHEREVATLAKWQVCPHPLLVTEVLDGQALQFVRLSVPAADLNQPWRAALQNPKRPFVPLHSAGSQGQTVYGLTSKRIAGEFGAMGFDVDLLGGSELPHNAVSRLLGEIALRGKVAVSFASVWASTPVSATPSGPTAAFSQPEPSMPLPREFDSRKRRATSAFAAPAGPVSPPATGGQRNMMTGSPAVISSAGLGQGGAGEKTLVERAMGFMGSQPAGFGAGPVTEFTPDPVIQRTSAGAAVVNLKQMFHGLPVFQMVRSVRFAPDGNIMDATGDHAPIPPGLSTDPKLGVEDAVLKAAQHLATAWVGEGVADTFRQMNPLPTIDVKGFTPEVVAGFPLPSRPTVLDKGPFENQIPAHLVIFPQQSATRLGWYVVLTFPGYTDQYIVIVAADNADGEILYCKSTMQRATARGRVFEFSPGMADRRLIDFPRPLSDFPAMPSMPLSGFPVDWVDVNKTFGNSTRATLNFTSTTLTGVINGGVVVFDPVHNDGDEQKLLNIFYFCNYMHDFLYILGFDEASGNFQQLNFTHTGSARDPVRARAHSGPVNGTANMATGHDGLPPLMNMGLVSSTGRHTAFDADVVFHEYTHGLTNRTVMGGRMNAPHSLDAIQSSGMGEGWSDYYAMTIQNFFRAVEKTVTGDWVVDDPAGIRRAPYDDHFPFKYDDLVRSGPNPQSGREDEHDIGEVWCAALMMMTRKMRLALGNDQQGYRLAWQIVTDGLKLTSANPTFLTARDAILEALDQLVSMHRIPPATNVLVRRAAWEAFAHFGMGVNASSNDADRVDDIVADSTLPVGV